MIIYARFLCNNAFRIEHIEYNSIVLTASNRIEFMALHGLVYGLVYGLVWPCMACTPRKAGQPGSGGGRGHRTVALIRAACPFLKTRTEYRRLAAEYRLL